MDAYRPEKPENPTPIPIAIQAAGRTCPLVDHLLGKDGPIAKGMPGWQDRPGQRALAQCVRRAWKQELPAITEGATGVGKSQALLIPAILRAIETKKPVVVSTATIQLQRQYLDTDLPLLLELLTPWLQEHFGRTFTFAGLFGRTRYLCEKKFASVEDETIAEWLATTVDGELGGLPMVPDAKLKRAITAEKDECPGARCAIAKDGGCWFYSARKRAYNSDVVVVNHALLMASTLADPGTVLPIWGTLVVDEAHTLEEIARQARGVSFTAAWVKLLAKQALEFCGEHRQGGLVEERLEDKYPDVLPEGFTERLQEAATAYPYSAHSPTLEGITAELDAFFRSVEDTVRRDARDGTALLPTLEATAAAEHLDELSQMLRRLAIDVEDTGDQHWEESQEKAQADVLQGSLDRTVAELRSLRAGRPGQVSWMQLAREKTPAAIHAQPVDVSEFLKDFLWKKAPAALSSATLATGGDEPFRYVQDSLGLRTLHQAQIASPFDWPTQAWLYLPEEGFGESLLGLKVRGAEEREKLNREYARVAALHLEEVLGHTKGRAFLLFTSAKQLQLTEAALRERGMKWPYLVQGEMGQEATIDWFRTTPGAVLFALASFWEGVSVEGAALSCVYIDRLSLPPPSDLLHEARLRRVGGGVSAFKQVTLPLVITKMKQAFGRLIRLVTDRGLVVLGDPRLRTKDYGKTILASLPPARRITRAHLKQVPWLLASSGEPCPGPADVAERLRQLAGAAIPDAEHAAYAKRLAARLPLLTPGLWKASEWLCERYRGCL